ncbi:hypothetical protein FB639_004878, partial [Coemansia asiatica]
MNTVASAEQHQSSSYLGGMATPNPFSDDISTPCKTASSSRHSSLAVAAGAETTQTCATAVSRSGSPIGTLVKDIQSSLHLKGTINLDRDNMKPPPAFEPFRCESPFEIKTQSTPLLLKSRKRAMEEMSPGLGLGANSPTPALWNRSRGRKIRGSVLAGSPGLCGMTLFGREDDQNAENDSSLDDEGSLSMIPRIRSSTMRSGPLEQSTLDCTPSRSLGSKNKRIRSTSKCIPTFLPIQEECDAELVTMTPSRTPVTTQSAAFLSPTTSSVGAAAAA